MSIPIPTVQENIDECLAFLEGELGQESAINNKSFLLVLSRLQGMIKSSLYLFSAEQIKRVLALTAEDGDLDAIGDQYDVNRKPAATAVLTIEVSGVPGTTIPITTTWRSDSNGMRYFQNLEYVVGGGGTVSVDVSAENIGVNGNLRINTVLNIGGTIDDIVPEAPVTAVAETGADAETNDDYRIRVLDELRTVGGGSNSADIRTWGQQTPNVKKIDPYTGDFRPPQPEEPVIANPGERTVFVEATESYDPDGIADQTLLDDVREMITTDPDTGRSRQALGSVDELLYVESITRLGFTLNLHKLNVDASKLDACKADIETAADEFLRDFVSHVDGLDPPGFRNNIITSVAVSEIVQDIVESYQGSVDRIEVFNDLQPGFPIGNYKVGPGERAKGSVVYDQ